VFGPLANIFFKGHHPYVRQFIGGMTRELFPEPAVFVNGPPVVKGRAFGSSLDSVLVVD
jgi:hypothetical protein